MKKIFYSVVCLMILAVASEASHFRFGNISWRRVQGAPNPRTIEITFTEAWRSGADDFITYNLGDGTSINTGAAPTIATLTDISGEQYIVQRQVVTKTYATDGPFTVTGSSCCRISSLINAGDDSFVITAVVDLRGSNVGSPVSSIPVILQMAQGGLNSIQVAAADPDSDPLTYRMATAVESGIGAVASAGGQALAISSSGLLTWNTVSTVVGQKYAAQVIVLENHPGGTSGRIPLDFIIEITGGTLNRPPTATGPVGPIVVPVGVPFAGTITGTDPDGDILTAGVIGLPSGSTLVPPSGSSGASPLSLAFSWTPTAADKGSAKAITFLFTDPAGLQAQHTLAISVPVNAPPTITCPPDNALQAPGFAQVTAAAKDADGDVLSYITEVNNVQVDTGNVPGAGLGSEIQWGQQFGLGVNTVKFTVSDGTATASCTTKITVADTLPPVVNCSALRMASGVLYTLGAIDGVDQNPGIFVVDSVSGFVAGPFRSGSKVHVQIAPTRPPSSVPLTGAVVARIQLKGAPLFYATDATGNSSTPGACN